MSTNEPYFRTTTLGMIEIQEARMIVPHKKSMESHFGHRTTWALRVKLPAVFLGNLSYPPTNCSHSLKGRGYAAVRSTHRGLERRVNDSQAALPHGVLCGSSGKLGVRDRAGRRILIIHGVFAGRPLPVFTACFWSSDHFCLTSELAG
jgi:hypothetical protein